MGRWAQLPDKSTPMSIKFASLCFCVYSVNTAFGQKNEYGERGPLHNKRGILPILKLLIFKATKVLKLVEHSPTNHLHIYKTCIRGLQSFRIINEKLVQKRRIQGLLKRKKRLTSQKQLKPKSRQILVEHNPHFTCAFADHEKEACKVSL